MLVRVLVVRKHKFRFVYVICYAYYFRVSDASLMLSHFRRNHAHARNYTRIRWKYKIYCSEEQGNDLICDRVNNPCILNFVSMERYV